MAVEILKVIVLLILLLVVIIVVGIINNSYDSRKFNEEEMRRVLEKYVPVGEKLIAGVHGYAAEVKIMFEILGNCSFDNELYPAEHGMAISGSKAKYAGYDVYLGITEQYFIFSECVPGQSYYYQFEQVPASREATAGEFASSTCLEDVGKGLTFTADDIQSCVIKSTKRSMKMSCNITLKNGSYFIIELPKDDKPAKYSPHYVEYRDAVLARLENLK